MKNGNNLPFGKSPTTTDNILVVRSILTLYPDYRKLYVPKDPIVKLKKKDNNKLPTKSGHRNFFTYSDETSLERSLRRTKKSITDYALCNKFEHFVTFTFKSDRQNISLCKQKMQTWLKNTRTRKGSFEYLIVPEFHADGISLHFHALIKGYKGKLEPAINPKTGKQIVENGALCYFYPSYTSGFTNVKVIEDTPKSHRAVGGYVSKYITKDMPILFGKNRYWASSGLTLPTVIENPRFESDAPTAIWSKESKYGTTSILPYRTKHDSSKGGNNSPTSGGLR